MEGVDPDTGGTVSFYCWWDFGGFLERGARTAGH